MAQATFVYDPTTARFQTEMHDVYRVLRDEFPVYEDPEHRFFAISRFADVWNSVMYPFPHLSQWNLNW